MAGGSCSTQGMCPVLRGEAFYLRYSGVTHPKSTNAPITNELGFPEVPRVSVLWLLRNCPSFPSGKKHHLFTEDEHYGNDMYHCFYILKRPPKSWSCRCREAPITCRRLSTSLLSLFLLFLNPSSEPFLPSSTKIKEIIKYIEVLFWHHLAGICAKKEMREKERKNKELWVGGFFNGMQVPGVHIYPHR